jgi:hypothetical protein
MIIYGAGDPRYAISVLECNDNVPHATSHVLRPEPGVVPRVTLANPYDQRQGWPGIHHRLHICSFCAQYVDVQATW